MTEQSEVIKHEDLKRIQKFATEKLAPYIAIMNENIERVGKLVTAASQLDGPIRQEILRSVIVLTHAFLEDFLRTIAINLLPEQNENVLNDIPLAGLGSGGRAEKFYLGKLASHRGKAIDDVIRESVSQYLDKSNFNSVSEIAVLLVSFGFNVSEHSAEFPLIEEMIQRRHVIVHRADRMKGVGKTSTQPQPVDSVIVGRWVKATNTFMLGLLAPTFKKLNSPELIVKKLGINIEDE